MEKKNILMISPMFPYPAHSGDKLRILNSIRELSKNYNISLICLSENDIDEEYKQYIEKFCCNLKVINKYISKKNAMIKFPITFKTYHEIRQDCTVLQGAVYEELISSGKVFDYIYFHFYHSMTSINLDLLNRNIKVIVDEHNADELIWETIFNNSNLIKKVMVKVNINRIKKFKKKRKDSIDYLVSVSRNDLEFNKKENKIKGINLLVPNGVNEIKPMNNYLNVDKNIVFVGSMDVTMNIEAVLHFYNNIYPLIKENVKDCKFYIVGKNPTPKIMRLQEQDKSVIVTGEVKDIKEYYEKAKVCIAPFKIGGGTKLKIIESMMMKKILVSTSCGCQGIDVEDKVHLIIENEDVSFAKAVEDILNNNIDTNEIVTNAFNLANEKYTWKNIFENMAKSIQI